MSGLSEENANTASSEVDSIMFLGRLDMVQHVSDAIKERCFEISEIAYVAPTPTFHPHQKSPGVRPQITRHVSIFQSKI